MQSAGRSKLSWAYGVYWFLLVYIIAALVWWFISLQNQNLEIRHLQEQLLQQLPHGAEMSAAQAADKQQGLQLEERRNFLKFLSEGITFLVLILVGAVYVFRSVNRQLRFQRQQQDFMMAITHELKTPIAVTKLNLETLKRHALDPAQKEKLMGASLQEIQRLNTLTNNILLSAQLEEHRNSTVKEEFNLSELFLNAIGEFRDRFPLRKCQQDIEPDCDILGDPTLIKILINNLLENAHKYSATDTMISCTLTATASGPALSVADEGEGIADDDKKKIFKKYYRRMAGQSSAIQGTGLGLYLCQRIAHDHQAHIQVTDNVPKGSIFTVQFNRLKA
jgi:signal transduction histidine kinase